MQSRFVFKCALPIGAAALFLACGGGGSGTSVASNEAAADDGSSGDAPSAADGDGLEGSEASASPADAGEEATPDAGRADAACSGGTTLTVDAVSGDDTHSGSSNAPLKTLTRAIALAGASAACVNTIDVRSGTYDVGNGERFPLIPANIAILGDEANKGNLTGASVFVNGNPAPSHGTFELGPNVTLAGLKIGVVPPAGDGGFQPTAGVFLSAASSGAIVRNDTLDRDGYGIQMLGGANVELLGNVITGNESGIRVFAGGPVRIEGNVVTGGLLGINIYEAADLGGGNAGSLGSNVVSCNTEANLYAPNTTSNISVSARNNKWDHVPPTTATTPGTPVDVITPTPTVTVDATGAALAPSPCP